MLKPYPRREVGVYAVQFLPKFPESFHGLQSFTGWLTKIQQENLIVRWELLLMSEEGPTLKLEGRNGIAYVLYPGDYILADDESGNSIRACGKQIFEDLYEVISHEF